MENIAKLNEAFSTFTQASKSLEAYYKKLHERVRYLTKELEKKNLELKQAVLDLNESRDYLQAVLQSIGEAMIVTDQDEKIAMINRAAERLFCIDAHNAVGRAFDDLDFLIDNDESSNTALTVKGKRYDIILSRSTVFDSEGLVRGHVILINDITRLKELEQQQERNSRLIAMGEMAAKIVHEIRSPLCSIELFSNMLSKDLEGTPHTEIARGISTGISSLNNILTNMLFFAKAQKPSFKNVGFNNAIEESIKMIAPLMEIRGIKLYKEITDEMAPGDPELMKQVFMNIFLNAVQAMPEGGLLKTLVRANCEFVKVEISDEGEGISSENIEKIFDPFFSTKDKGTGLGLTIANKIMQCHKGLIKVYNNENKGCTFCLYFPKR